MPDWLRDVDLMNIYKGDELFSPYEDDDGWLVILPGEEDGRRERTGKTLVARTLVTIELDNMDDLKRCVVELEESDRRIRELGDGNDWDWQKVKTNERMIKFGVAWYDREFFEQRKEAWSDPTHARMYERFNASPDNFHVEHELVDS